MLGFTNASKMPTYTVPSWSTGTDDEIARALQKHYAGKINLHDYWSVGDERQITLSAMSATGVGESHAAQSVTMVLMDSTCQGFTLTNEQVTPAFIVGQKDSLNETGYMNSSNTNTGGWQNCLRRTWCNNVYKEAFPSTIKSIFKQFTWKQGLGGGTSSGLNTTNDYFGLTPEKAILGSRSYSYSDEAALYSQWTWYQTAANRIKKINGSANYWWEGSPYATQSSYFCIIYDDATSHGYGSSVASGIAPFGCI